MPWLSKDPQVIPGYVTCFCDLLKMKVYLVPTLKGSPREGGLTLALCCTFSSFPEPKSCQITLASAIGHTERLWFYLVSTSLDPPKHAENPKALLPEHSHEHTLATCLSDKTTPPQHHTSPRASQKYNFCIPFPKSPELGSAPALNLGDLNGSWMGAPYSVAHGQGATMLSLTSPPSYNISDIVDAL